MNVTTKNEIVEEIAQLLDKAMMLLERLKKSDKPEDSAKQEDIELISLKDCGNVVKGLSEYSARQLALRGDVKSVRVGEGTRGKILINKRSLIDYFSAKILDTSLKNVYDN